MGLNPALLQALTSEGYTTPTPIQQQAIPDVMAGKDLLGIAQTGTGKTAAFALPILHRLAANRTPPVPVWAMPSKSLPAMTSGMACCWIGVGVV